MTGVTRLPSKALHGRRILVVEDEYMIAQELAEMLSQAGAEALGPVPAIADALHILSAEKDQVDAALLDVNLRDGSSWPVVDALLARGVPVVLTTGYDVGTIPPAYAKLPLCEKPGTTRDLIQVLERALA